MQPEIENESQTLPKKMNKFKKLAIIFSAVLIVLIGLGGLTKAGFIPNYLNIEILCPEEEEPFWIKQNASDECRVHGICVDKPVLYLYPQQKMDVSVQLDYQGEITADYPKYDESIKGWDVTAYPYGKIINHADNKEYSYLFWEGKSDSPIDWDFSKGFVVKGEETREFLQTTLSKMGLTPKEYNEFIVYWYPLMKDNEYNLIHFANDQYTKTAPLTITPEPDSILRVFMVYKALNEKVAVEVQEIKPFEREGFTVVEWGGTESK